MVSKQAGLRKPEQAPPNFSAGRNWLLKLPPASTDDMVPHSSSSYNRAGEACATVHGLVIGGSGSDG